MTGASYGRLLQLRGDVLDTPSMLRQIGKAVQNFYAKSFLAARELGQ